jgi:16S rRNA (cytosine967-C5)-methyltransferase
VKSATWIVRFVNGVMRAAVRKGKKIPLPAYEDDPVRAIAVRESHPVWLIDRWIKRLGMEETKELCQANNKIPPITVRANTLKISREDLLAELTDFAKEITPTKHAPDGISLRGLQRALFHIPCFKQGWFQIQDEASQLITNLLDPKPGQILLDACAGLGGKTSHMAQLTKDQGKITAVDNQAWKLQHLEQTMARLGISSVETLNHDLLESIPSAMTGIFDRVLLDAPCSGLGVLRRNPDAKWKKDEASLPGLQANQLAFLDGLAPAVKEGGFMVYAVCSSEPEEGEQVVRNFLERHAEFVVDQEPGPYWKDHEGLLNNWGFLRTFPHKHDMDGFFAVRFKRVVS